MPGWLFDMSILCPMCGKHRLKYSDMMCPKTRETLNEKYFIILKFTELEYKIKELEKDEETETKLSDGEVDNGSSEG